MVPRCGTSGNNLGGELVNCDYCRKAIDEKQRHWLEVRGWVNTKGAKGFTLDEHLDGRMHDECMKMKKAGILPGQKDIFGNYSDEPVLF